MLFYAVLALGFSCTSNIAIALLRRSRSGVVPSISNTSSSLLSYKATSRVIDDRIQGYLWHDACQTGEGIGALLRRVRPALSLARIYNLTYVCNYLEFKTHSHGALDLGYLFGCQKDLATGLFMDLHALPNVTWVNSALKLKSSAETAPSMAEGSFWLHGPVVTHLKDLVMSPEPIKASTNALVYKLQGCVDSAEWGIARQMLREQFHSVRKIDPRRRVPSAWKMHPGQQALWRIAVHIRRGDLPRKLQTDVTHFIEALEHVLYVRLPALNAERSDTRIVVLAEDSDPAPYKALEELGASLLLVDANSSTYDRFVRDLDHLATANIQILSDSAFSILGAALQPDNGIALRVGTHSRALTGDLPNVFQCGRNGIPPPGIEWTMLRK
eukprot:gnl/MRDRNA2_/MRDRNA2_117455_c0_seq1.p1 gnl/MRDRNA2_/MRDRNA2_117455_c0~~gnl/MRDRNA2_/MRDRNA2_117455_c0_seq1.p1  ORF type:complete len:385 (-),score=56.96 gnl/MRDRNA2_/MRDRNA2_117455_c0_seq1:69-1223(-)